MHHTRAHGNYTASEVVAAAVANRTLLATTDVGSLSKAKRLIAVAQLATALTRARPLR